MLRCTLFAISLLMLSVAPLYAQDKEPPLGKVATRGGARGPESFDQAMDWLKSGNQLLELIALGSLERTEVYPKRQKEIAAQIEKMSNGKDGLVALAAIRALGVWATPDQVPSLIKHLESTSPFMRGGALDALGTTKDERAIPHLARFLHAFGESENAMRGLITIGTPVEEEVRKYLKSSEATARANAERVLKLIGKTGKDDAYIAALGAIQSDNFFGMQKGLQWFEKNDPTPAAQADAAKSLASLLNNDNPFVKGGASNALVKWATKDQVPALLDALKAGRKNIAGNRSLVRALARLRDDRAIPLLASALDGPDGPESVKALIAIGSVAEDEVLAVLEDADNGYRAKSNACQILEEIGTKKSLEPIRAARTAAETKMFAGWRDVQQSAREAIKAIEKRK